MGAIQSRFCDLKVREILRNLAVDSANRKKTQNLSKNSVDSAF
ncbi:hypothetical protein [Helicobacter sp. 23-1045]